MSEKQFTLEQWTKHSLYYSDGEYSAHMSIGFICEKVEKNLNEQQATIEEYKDFFFFFCKFLIQKDFVDEYREKYGKEYKIITKWW